MADALVSPILELLVNIGAQQVPTLISTNNLINLTFTIFYTLISLSYTVPVNLSEAKSVA